MTDPAAQHDPDDLRVRVEPGSSIVVRLPGLIAIIDAADPDTTGALLEVLRAASGAATPRGAELSRRLADWLADTDEAPSFGTAAASQRGLALFLYGDACAILDAGMKPDVTGREGAFAVDRVVPWPASTVRLTIGESSPTTTPSGLPAWAGLISGVTVGAAVTMEVDRMMASPSRRGEGPDTADLPAPHTADPPAAPVGIEQPAPESGAPAPADRSRQPLTQPLLFERIHGADAPETRAPLPVEGTTPRLSQQERHREAVEHAAARPGAYVRGFRCSRGHLNDPRVSFCGVCGIRMDQLTGVLVFERRPPLGLFVLDAGTTFVLDDNYIIGRAPDVSQAVRDGSHRPIRIDDRSGSTSRVHSAVRLVDWDVQLVDLGSANGTYIADADSAPPGVEPRWRRLAPHQPFTLTPGTHVLIGRRRFVFESASARV